MLKAEEVWGGNRPDLSPEAGQVPGGSGLWDPQGGQKASGC